MTFWQLLMAYALVGGGLSIVVYRKSHERGLARISEAALTIPLWPLWAPAALSASSPATAGEVRSLLGKRITLALDEAAEVSRGSQLESLLPNEAVAEVRETVLKLEARHGELGRLLAKGEYNASDAANRLAGASSDKARLGAQLHLRSVARLKQLRDQDAETLEELAHLIEGLRTQLVLARYEGASREEATGLLTEVWARVEGVSSAFDDAPPMEVVEHEQEHPRERSDEAAA